MVLIVAGIYPLFMGNGYISVAIKEGRENTYPKKAREGGNE